MWPAALSPLLITSADFSADLRLMTAAIAPEPHAKSSTLAFADGSGGRASSSARVITSRPPPAKRPGYVTHLCAFALLLRDPPRAQQHGGSPTFGSRDPRRFSRRICRRSPRLEAVTTHGRASQMLHRDPRRFSRRNWPENSRGRRLRRRRRRGCNGHRAAAAGTRNRRCLLLFDEFDVDQFHNIGRGAVVVGLLLLLFR